MSAPASLRSWSRRYFDQKNELLTLITDAGFDPSEFEWGRMPSSDGFGPIPSLLHRPSRSHFSLDTASGGFRVERKPGEESVEDVRIVPTWQVVSGAFNLWLMNIRRETEAPDLWAELARQTELAAPPENSANTPFTSEERALIAEQLREVRTFVEETYELNEGQTRLLEAHLEPSLRRGRSRWAA